MPKINIREEEVITFSSFDATENIVMVPMVYIKGVDENGKIEDLPGPKLFSNVTSFREFYDGHLSYLETKEDKLTGTQRKIYDRSYFMIYELLMQNIGVLVIPIDGGAGTSDEKFEIDEDKQKALISALNYDNFGDRNLYNIKFITSGAYSNLDTAVYTKMVNLAVSRGDAIALLELPQDTQVDQLYDLTKGCVGYNYKFATINYPWCTFTTTAEDYIQPKTMPASFAYLMAFANSARTNANWFAAAGTIRGLVPNLISTRLNIGEALMHYLQNDDNSYDDGSGILDPLEVNINPIYNAGSYGYRIWGNKVAWKKTDAESSQYLEYLNVRILMCDIKKQVFHAAMRVTFEPNDDIVWYNFKSLANTLLDKMKSGRGIKWYKWFKEPATEKATIKATLTIQPIEAVESFDINIVLTDQDATVKEDE